MRTITTTTIEGSGILVYWLTLPPATSEVFFLYCRDSVKKNYSTYTRKKPNVVESPSDRDVAYSNFMGLKLKLCVGEWEGNIIFHHHHHHVGSVSFIMFMLTKVAESPFYS